MTIALFGTLRRRYRQLRARRMPRDKAGKKRTSQRRLKSMLFGMALDRQLSTPPARCRRKHDCGRDGIRQPRRSLHLGRPLWKDVVWQRGTLCSKILVSTHSENVRQIVSLIVSFLSEIHEAKVHVFSASVFFLVEDAGDARRDREFEKKVGRQKITRCICHLKSINSKFLLIAMRVQSQSLGAPRCNCLAAIKQHVSSIRDDIGQECSPETYPRRII